MMVHISQQTFVNLNSNQDKILTRQEILKADTDGDGQISQTEAKKEKVELADLPVLNQALTATANMAPNQVLFAIPAKAKTMPEEIPLVGRLSKTVMSTVDTTQATRSPEETIQDWRKDITILSRMIRGQGTEKERRDRLATALDTMSGDKKIQWGSHNEDLKDQTHCPQSPLIAFIRAGFITADQAQRLLGQNGAEDLLGTETIVRELFGVTSWEKTPLKDRYPIPEGIKPENVKPKAGDVAFFTDPKTDPAPLFHVAIFNGEDWNVVSVQANLDNPSEKSAFRKELESREEIATETKVPMKPHEKKALDDLRTTSPDKQNNPTVETDLDTLLKTEFPGSVVIICRSPFSKKSQVEPK